jgi:hypothetical protein
VFYSLTDTECRALVRCCVVGPGFSKTLKDDTGNLKPLASFVGRFLDFKRVPLLVRAVSRGNEMIGGPDDPRR